MARRSAADTRLHMLKFGCALEQIADSSLEFASDARSLADARSVCERPSRRGVEMPWLSVRSAARHLSRLEDEGFIVRLGRGRYRVERQRVFDAYEAAEAQYLAR